MLEYIKKLITPDMVSFWLPSGQNRAMDIIRGNHGRCSGTHPNVLILPNLINLSLGWYFDGVDDYIKVPNATSLQLTGNITIGLWVKVDRTSCGSGDAQFIVKRVADDDREYEFRYVVSTQKLKFLDSNDVLSSNTTLANVTWTFVVATRDVANTEVKFYFNATLDVTRTSSGSVSASSADVNMGERAETGHQFAGYMVFPFVANGVWSVAQINNFYLATKGLFAPRG